ncbi:MAG: lysophospholipid acyltransferase family protein [Thermoleophilia bacterium]|nr:lysophospholipid acyltransferase family protein [Thermoleophilia bacterium]
MSTRDRLDALRLAPDGKPRPEAPFGQGPLAARGLRAAIVAASAVASRLPLGVITRLTDAGSTLEWACRPGKRRRLASNLCHTLGLPPDHPDVKALVRREVRNEARRSADFLWALARPDELRATTVIEGREHIDTALARGHGVLLVSTHVGGWEVATALPKAIVPVATTAIVTDDWLAWAVEGLRVRVGLGIMYDSEPATKAARLLRDGQAILVIGDYAKDWMRTYPVRLLDALAELPAGVASLARLCGTPVVPFSVLPVAPRRWRVEIEPPLDPPARDGGVAAEQALLQQVADRWTATLRTNAEHWAAVYPMTWHEGE